MKKLLLFGAIALSFTSFTQVPNYVPTNGLVGWWPFNGNANDESGNGNNGTVNGATLTSDRNGTINSAFSYNGSSSRIEIPDNNSLDVSNISISLWFITSTYSASNGYGPTLFSKRESSGWGGAFQTNIGLLNSNNSCWADWTIGSNGGIYYQGPNPVPLSTNNWYHYVYTHDNNTVKLYINGVLVQSLASPGSLSPNNLPAWIGARPNAGVNSSYYQGKIDDVGLWNRVLSQCEIQDLYSAQLNSATGISAGSDQSVCEGNDVTLSGTGGSNYQWNNSVVDGTPFTPTATQNYIVTAEDGNGCLGVDTVLVTVNPLAAINGGADQVVCEGDPVTLSGSGGNSYNWNNGITDGVSFTPSHLGDLTYTVTGTDANNCSNSDEVVVTVNEHTTATQTETALDSYTWPVNNQTYTQSGTYTAVITNEAGCDSTITLNLTMQFTGIRENESFYVAVYPNPTTSFLTIVGEGIQNKEFTLVDIQGRVVLNGTFKTNKETIDIKTLARGQYMLKVEGKEMKVVKE